MVDKDRHEALIARDVFDAVQVKLKRRRRTKKHASKDYALTGVLVCGHCGKPLYGSERSDNKHAGNVRYLCKGVNGCPQWAVKEKDIMPFLVATLLDQIDRREIAKAHTMLLPAKGNGETEGQRKKIAKLKGQYETGMNRFLSLDNSAIANDLQDKLEVMKKQIAKMEKEILAAEIPESRVERLRKIQAVRAELREKLVFLKTWQSPNGKMSYGFTLKKQSLRELFHRIGLKVELWFERASECRYRIVRGRLRAGGRELFWESDPAQFDGGASLTV